jgi:hypothetical protein
MQFRLGGDVARDEEGEMQLRPGRDIEEFCDMNMEEVRDTGHTT